MNYYKMTRCWFHTDVDECYIGDTVCDEQIRANCTNTIGSYLCTCLTGFSGDGMNCTGMKLRICVEPIESSLGKGGEGGHSGY